MARQQITVFAPPGDYYAITGEWSRRRWEILDFPRYRRRPNDVFIPLSHFDNIGSFLQARRTLASGIDHHERRWPTFLRVTCKVYEGVKRSTLSVSTLFFVRLPDAQQAILYKLRYV